MEGVLRTRQGGRKGGSAIGLIVLSAAALLDGASAFPVALVTPRAAARHAHAVMLAPPAAQAAERRTLDFEGHATRYVKAGAPSAKPGVPPVVLVHGFGGSSGQWRATVADLAAAGRTVYALDLLGFGASPKAKAAYSIELWARQLRACSEVPFGP